MGEKANSSQTTNPSSCFICNEPQRARDYPKKEKLNALSAIEDDHSELNTPTTINLLHLLNAIQAETHKNLIYVELVGIKPLKARHDVTKLGLTIPLLSL